MGKRLTIREVAEHSGLSKTTVGYVLSGRADVAIPDITRARVFQAAKELGYRRNRIARSFATGKSQNVGVVVSYQGYVNGYQDAFVSRVLYGLQESCAGNQYGVLITAARDATDTAEEQVNALLEQKVAALVIVGRLPGVSDGSLLQEIFSEHVPCVAVDDRSMAGIVDCIITDDKMGASTAVRHLISRGRCRIAHLAAGTSTTTAQDRRAGYLTALAEAGINFDDNLTETGSFSPKEAILAASRLLSLPSPPDAVFADSDYLATAVLQAASRRGLRVPDDVALVGYGNLEVAEWLDVTTIKQNPEEMGRRAAAIVHERIGASGYKPAMTVLPTELIVRGSCGRPI